MGNDRNYYEEGVSVKNLYKVSMDIVPDNSPRYTLWTKYYTADNKSIVETFLKGEYGDKWKRRYMKVDKFAYEISIVDINNVTEL